MVSRPNLFARRHTHTRSFSVVFQMEHGETRSDMDRPQTTWLYLRYTWSLVMITVFELCIDDGLFDQLEQRGLKACFTAGELIGHGTFGKAWLIWMSLTPKWQTAGTSLIFRNNLEASLWWNCFEERWSHSSKPTDHRWQVYAVTESRLEPLCVAQMRREFEQKLQKAMLKARLQMYFGSKVFGSLAS